MKNLLIFILILVSFSQDGNQYILTVKVDGLAPLKGDLYIGLHSRPEYYHIPDSAFMKKKVSINKATEILVFEGVPEGKYGVALYHDENLNGIMDTHENGMPVEGYGFSVKSKFLGKPKFEQAMFDFNGNDTISIKMVYLNRVEKNG